jgi:cohesin complex subunit SA-1/2
MDLSDPTTPNSSIDMNGTANRRKSGRVRQKPVLLNKDPNIPQITSSGAKRKRADTFVKDVGGLSDGDMDEESSPEESDPDEEELKERRRRTKKAPSKPASKKPKAGSGLSMNLAVRPAINGVKKTSRPKQPRARPVKNAADDGTGLYG